MWTSIVRPIKKSLIEKEKKELSQWWHGECEHIRQVRLLSPPPKNAVFVLFVDVSKRNFNTNGRKK
jgi:hypothetical protein